MTSPGSGEEGKTKVSASEVIRKELNEKEQFWERETEGRALREQRGRR